MEFVEFESSLTNFVQRYNRESEIQFQLKQGFAVLRLSITPLQSTTASASTDSSELIDPTLSEPFDPSCSPESSSETPKATLELHITFSKTFKVPVLLFNAWDKQGALLPFTDVISPSLLSSSSSALGPVITQQDHPILNIPFHAIHPCNTHNLVTEMMEEGNGSSMDYVWTWWSIVRQAFPLTQPSSTHQE